ncbi:serine hydrolase domain-containing protein [Bdellovibrio sp. HCB274]|uniref:serine hydrolase domain-containing protein n=1 Tax=Bdellovibrio sp. HCB274 TaxID=3394361 RepID=UPI0039B65B9F
MLRLLLSSLFLLATLGCASKPVAPTNANFEEILKEFIEKHNIPGGAMAVSKNGVFAYNGAAGFSDKEKQMLTSAATPFRIASSTKPLTAIAVFQLLEKSGGDIPTALNRPVFGNKGYLPEYKNIKDKRVLKVTLKDLLQHTGGWGSEKDDYDPQYDLFNISKKMKSAAPADAKTVIRYVLQYKNLDRAPGSQYHYSNFGYNVLARVIEKLSGQPYEDYLKTNVMAPLGITDMRIGGSRLIELLPEESRYYDDPRSPMVTSQFDGTTKGPMAYNEFYLPTMDGHGGWIGTPSDLVLILHAVTPGLGKTQLLKPETVELMVAPNTNIGNPTASMGWVSREGGKEFGHAGALETGTLSYFVKKSNGVAWAVIFNRLPIEKVEEIGPLLQGLSQRMDQEFTKLN